MPSVAVNDISMWYEIHGTGEPLVVIAGLALDVSEYPSMVQAFATKYQVIMFGNRGVGRTDKPDIPYTIDMMADVVACIGHPQIT